MMRQLCVRLALTTTMLSLGHIAQAQSFDLSWSTIDGGGAVFIAGDNFELSGTIGQPDAGLPTQPLTGGTFSLIGGFWPRVRVGAIPGDLNGDGHVTLQDLATLLAHFGQQSGATRADGDLDADGDVDVQDLSILLAHFGT